jgi:hypothetical protein
MAGGISTREEGKKDEGGKGAIGRQPHASGRPSGARAAAADRKQGGAGPAGVSGCSDGVRKKKVGGILVQEGISTMCASLRLTF